MIDILRDHFWACWWAAMLTVYFVTWAVANFGRKDD